MQLYHIHPYIQSLHLRTKYHVIKSNMQKSCFSFCIMLLSLLHLVKYGIISMEKEKLERKQKMLFSIKFKLKVREKENNVAC